MRYSYLFQLLHIKTLEIRASDIVTDKKELGLYSSLQAARSAQARYSNLIGFVDFPNDFHILKRRVYLAACHTKLLPGIPIYLLKNEFYEDDYDIVTDFGFYTGMDEAKAAVLQLSSYHRKGKSYLSDPTNYTIGELNLDIDNPYWSEGFE